MCALRRLPSWLSHCAHLPPLFCDCRPDRYDGKVPNDSTYPTVQVRDPRSALTRIWARIEVAELTVPKFRVRVGRRGAGESAERTVAQAERVPVCGLC